MTAPTRSITPPAAIAATAATGRPAVALPAIRRARAPGASHPSLRNAIAVVSGKGGVGKTNIATNLAVAMGALGGRTLLVDGDLGLANVDVLLGLVGAHSSADLISGGAAVEEAIIEGPRGIHVLPAFGGSASLAALAPEHLASLLRGLRSVSGRYDVLLIDAGAGIGPTVVGLARACAHTLVVTNSEPTSLADAYATLKVLASARGAEGRRGATASDGGLARPISRIVLNEVDDARDARQTYAQLQALARRFLAIEVGYAGHLPRDRRLTEAVSLQRAVVELHPSAPVSRKLIALAQTLLCELRSSAPGATR